jgi:hypothetical protein
MFLEDSVQIPSQRNRIPCIRSNGVIFCPDAQLSKHNLSRRRELSVWTFLCELLQLASVRTFQQHVRMPLSVRSAMGFLSKTQIWEDSCNLPDDVDSRPDALIHKAGWAFKIQTSGQQSSWSGRTSYTYENCVHQINCPDDMFFGLDAQSLDMEIACS